MEDKLISWNVNGLNCPPKRNIIFNWILKQNSKISCLQETHLSLKNQKLLKKEKLGEVFHSLINKKRGMFIYANKDLDPKLKFVDKDGRYVATEVKMNGQRTLIVNVYAPNRAK